MCIKAISRHCWCQLVPTSSSLLFGIILWTVGTGMAIAQLLPRSPQSLRLTNNHLVSFKGRINQSITRRVHLVPPSRAGTNPLATAAVGG